MPGCEAVQRGGVVVCWRVCRSIDMEGGLGYNGYFGVQQRRSVIRHKWSREGGDGERHTKPRDSLPEGASLCVAWVLPNF